jgi:hypothetical protein
MEFGIWTVKRPVLRQHAEDEDDNEAEEEK